MMRAKNWKGLGFVVAFVALCLIFAISASAQVQTQQTTTASQATKQVTVERGEVVAVEGNDLFVKMEDGSIRHFPNISESARINVDGKQVGIHDLKPGMKLQRTLTVTTTPQVVTTVQSVTGKVFHVNPPLSVILTLEDGTNQSFKIPKGQKFTINGQETDAFGLKKGMVVTATKIVEEPVNVIEHQKQVTGTMPPAPPAPSAGVPILVASAAPAPAAGTPAQLPKTGSNLPSIALLGLFLISFSLGIKLFRLSMGR